MTELKRGEPKEAHVRLVSQFNSSDKWIPVIGSPVCVECAEHGHDESGFSHADGGVGSYRVTFCASLEPGVGDGGCWLCDEHLITEAVERDTLARVVIFGDEPGECAHLVELEDFVLFAKLRDGLHEVARSCTITQRLAANSRVVKLVRGALERERAAFHSAADEIETKLRVPALEELVIVYDHAHS